MTDRDRLIGLLSDAIHLRGGICRVIGKNRVEEIADYLIANGVTFHGWIPVSLGFTPEPFVSVLGYMSDAGDFPAVRECYRVDDEHYFFPALGECHPVSYWMPMPTKEV